MLLNSEREDSPSSPSLKRETATAQLSGPYQTNQGKQTGAGQEEQVTSSNLSSQTSFQSSGYYYRPSIQSQILPQPYSNLQSRQNRGLTFSADGSTDLPKVCWSIFELVRSYQINGIYVITHCSVEKMNETNSYKSLLPYGQVSLGNEI